jgi:hypothetical protein
MHKAAARSSMAGFSSPHLWHAEITPSDPSIAHEVPEDAGRDHDAVRASRCDHLGRRDGGGETGLACIRRIGRTPAHAQSMASNQEAADYSVLSHFEERFTQTIVPISKRIGRRVQSAMPGFLSFGQTQKLKDCAIHKSLHFSHLPTMSNRFYR